MAERPQGGIVIGTLGRARAAEPAPDEDADGATGRVPTIQRRNSSPPRVRGGQPNMGRGG